MATGTTTTHGVVKCFLCSSFAGSTFADVVRHIGAVHSCEPGFYITCGCNGCQRKFKNFHTYRGHLYKAHSAFLKGVVPPYQPTNLIIPQPVVDGDESDGDLGDLPEHQLALIPDSEVRHSPPLSQEESLRRSGALFILKTAEERRLTLTAVTGIIQDIQQLIGNVVTTIEERVMETLQSCALDTAETDGLKACFDNKMLVNPFRGLESEFLQMKYFTETMGLIEPCERVLGWRYESKPSGIVRYPETCCDVPLKASLEKLLNNSCVLRQISNPHGLDDGKLGDYCDGEQFKAHPLFSNDPYALQIQFYYDDLEVCNPLGSNVKTHKLGMFYYTLGNIHPQLRSTLRAIQLLSVVNVTLIEKYGMDEVLRPFVEELKEFEKDEGAELMIKGSVQCIRGSISVGSADNLGSQSVGGFKALNAALRKCRQCMAVDEDMQTKFNATSFQPRTRSTHDQQCQYLTGPLEDHMSTTYGIVRNCILNQSRYYHVADGLPPDCMHDILEGVLPYKVKLLLVRFIRERNYFTLATFNGRVKSFRYGVSESSKPSAISAASLCSSDKNLRQSASEMWCLARYLPLLIGDLVPENDEDWAHFLCLLDVVDIVFAPVCSDVMVAHLEHLIELYLTEFVRLYPDQTITPKMHYLVHYPEAIVKFGPLSRVWCMRFEAKNNYFKQMAHIVGNYKNIARTLSLRHQRLSCYLLQNDNDLFLGDSVSLGRVESHQLEALPHSDKLLAAIPGSSSTTTVSVCSWAKVHQTKYRPGGVVVPEVQDDIPIFSVIEKVVYTREELFLLLYDCPRAEYYPHYHAYCILRLTRCTPPVRVIKPHQLKDHHVYCFHQSSQSSHFVCLKYNICCD